MNTPSLGQVLSGSALGILALCIAARNVRAQAFVQTNLVSDLPGLAANLDPNLKNPWGISFSATSPFWVSDAGTGKATLYNSSGTPQALVVTIPSPGGVGPAVPTGQVFNSSNASGAFNGDLFLFASATGTISGWRPALSASAEVLVDNSAFGASYLGLALGAVDGEARLYGANFGNARIDAFSSTGAPVLAGSFTDPTLPAGYAPFNIQNLGGALFVTYAKVGATGEEETGPGKGFVDIFDLRGNFVSRLASNGVLDAPWGLAIAPEGFGPFGGNLLVGNFGDGTINAFDITTGALAGTLLNAQSQPIVNEGLWGLTFGNGGNGGNPGTLYFAAGIEDETHGLFGSIAPAAAAGVAEPASTAVLAAIAGLGLFAMDRMVRTSRVD